MDKITWQDHTWNVKKWWKRNYSEEPEKEHFCFANVPESCWPNTIENLDRLNK